MGHRKLLLGLLTLSLIGLAVGVFIRDVYSCGPSVYCYFLSIKGDALYYGMGGLALVFSILLAVPQAFSVWAKFAIWFVPLMSLQFATYKGLGLFDPQPESVFKWVSALYILISLVIISWHAYKPRKK